MFPLIAWAALAGCTSVYEAQPGDIVLQNDSYRLIIGADARARSLVLLGEDETELLDVREGTPLFSTTQERPFNNELKLATPNKRRSYQANRIRREGDKLIVGFECVPYEASVQFRLEAGYLTFMLDDFIVPEEHGYGRMKMDRPPVAEFRLMQLPVAERANFGDWLNVMWDDAAAVAVAGVQPQVLIDHENRPGFRVMTADLRPGMMLRGGKVAVVVGRGREAFLKSLESVEEAFDLPRGVKSRRSPLLNRSIYTSWDITPKTIDRHLEYAKRGGFQMMLINVGSIVKSAGYAGYELLGDYDWRPEYPEGAKSLREMLGKIRAAGIVPGLHTLQTHIGVRSRYVTPVLDPRLNKKRRFMLARPIPETGEPGEIFVEEPTVDAPMYEGARVLAFGGEAFSYEGYSTVPPYRFTGVKRGHYETRAAAHPQGEIGGVLDVCEYGGRTIYIDQNTSLQDEIALKIKQICDCGMLFCYLDGAEGVNPPCNAHVALSQLRVVRTFDRMPIFTEGAAKSHFSWHLQAGANAFDVFPPEKFKAMIVKFPQAEAPAMAKDMTRVDFGWWGLYPGLQPDMWEFGTSRAAAWDCPAAIQMPLDRVGKVARLDDCLEVMRRWEAVRVRGWLTAEMKERLKSSTQEHHLYLNRRGEYELHEIEMLPTPARAKNARGFVFEREGKTVLAYWHMTGAAQIELAMESPMTCPLDKMRYCETELSVAEVKAAWAAAVEK